MSKCYYIKNDGFVNLLTIKEQLQKRMGKSYSICLDEYDNSQGLGGCFYIEGEGSRGVHVFKEAGNIVVKLNTLCNYEDFRIARLILYMLNQIFDENIFDEEENIIDPLNDLTDGKIQEILETDAKGFYQMLQLAVNSGDTLNIPGVIRLVFFGERLYKIMSEHAEDPTTLAGLLESVMRHVQYEIPAYNMPNAAFIKQKSDESVENMKKIRMMFEGNNYILQDYDYLLICQSDENKEPIFIDDKDLHEIAPQFFDNDSEFEIADDITVVFPALSGSDWENFVSLAHKKNHRELLNAEPATQIVNQTPDCDEENDEEDENHVSSQCHGDHWDCVFKDSEKEFAETIQTVIQEGQLVGTNETDFILEEKTHGKVFELEYAKDDSDPLSARALIVSQGESNQFVSMYPVVRNGLNISLQLCDISEWENGLEAWLTGELSDGRQIVFFDADYAIHKNEYEIGNTYNFVLGALAYFAEEPESKGFSFEGQKAIDFKAKIGEEPEYDEDGNVKPVEFSTANLCAFLQFGSHAPDDAEFISTVDSAKTVNSFNNLFCQFNVIYKSDDSDEIKIPTYVQKNDKNKELEKAEQIQGVLWVVGFIADN